MELDKAKAGKLARDTDWKSRRSAKLVMDLESLFRNIGTAEKTHHELASLGVFDEDFAP